MVLPSLWVAAASLLRRNLPTAIQTYVPDRLRDEPAQWQFCLLQFRFNRLLTRASFQLSTLLPVLNIHAFSPNFPSKHTQTFLARFCQTLSSMPAVPVLAS